MPPPAPVPDEEHLRLMELLNFASVQLPFKSQTWKPSPRRNKTIKQILAEEARREAAGGAGGAGISAMATQNNSGATTPAVIHSAGTATPNQPTNGQNPPNFAAEASRSLSHLVLERNLQNSMAAGEGGGGGGGAGEKNNNNNNLSVGGGGGGGSGGVAAGGDATNVATTPAAGVVRRPVYTYTSIEAAPSIHPGNRCKKFCDVVGCPTHYKDPKTGLHYFNKEVFAHERTLAPSLIEQHLAARNAHVNLK